MDTQQPESPPGRAVFDRVLTGVDASLAEAERQVGTALKALRRLRRAAQEGDIAGLPGKIADAAEIAERAVAPLRAGAAAYTYDLGTAFADGSYLDELAAAAR